MVTVMGKMSCFRDSTTRSFIASNRPGTRGSGVYSSYVGHILFKIFLILVIITVDIMFFKNNFQEKMHVTKQFV